MEYSGTVNNYKKKNNLRHNKNNSMSNHINMSYNYNLRLIPKNKPINNFDPKAFKKSKNSNILSIPLNNGEPIKIKNKENLNNSINKILKKPRTPDLPQQYDNNKNHNHQNQIHPARYRAPSPIISVSLGLNNFLKKKNI